MEDNARTNDEVEFLWDGYDYITISKEPSAAKKTEPVGTAC